MKLIVGIAIGVFYLVLAAMAFGVSSAGWRGGHPDLGFWWAVIGALLGIAGLGAAGGTWLHTRSAED